MSFVVMELVSGRIMIFGVFDNFHPGHRNFIEQALQESHDVVLVVACDKNALRFKDSIRHSQADRLQVIQERYPDLRVIMGDEFDPLSNVKKYHPEKIFLGYDQIGFSRELQEHFPEIEVVHMKAYKGDVFG